jgi:hypothetical protein
MDLDTVGAPFAAGMPIERVGLVDTPLLIAGYSTALSAGVSGSVHCALMCGPLACASSGRSVSLSALWHVGRVAGYALVGAALGSLGSRTSTLLSGAATSVLPWVMAGGLIATALDLGKRLRPIPIVGDVVRLFAGVASLLGPGARALLMGLSTPLLPCGLLYGVFLAAWATSSAAAGAALMASFALGALPALGAAQAGVSMLARWPTVTWTLRRVVPLLAATALVLRAWVSSTTPGCH